MISPAHRAWLMRVLEEKVAYESITDEDLALAESIAADMGIKPWWQAPTEQPAAMAMTA